MSQAGRKLVIAIPIFDGIMALDAIGPFDCVQQLPNVEVVFVSHKPGPYKASYGALSLIATASFDDVPSPDVIIVPGGSGTRLLLEDEPLLKWIQKAHETTLYTTSVCTGSLLLAAAGLLKGVTTSSHWNAFTLLESYGAKPTSKRYVQEGKILTGAGVSAGIDMGLFLVSLLSDEETAKAVQLFIEYDPQPPFDCGSVSKATPEIVAIAKSFGARLLNHAQQHYKA
ncbi:cyclohexyl-isocyanide hydratase [Marchantia polymorpha subsp. ruderalis]|uniref:DJ-1/PfpI domain-containing protein n=2 Tax=Marchantia polymorpha TaxID=3197 RepID=A0A176VN50_MARPO|nr:hypothetical protein AXG93_1275s1420 [Marchantia polymorpha subsp. ruderalis]PTQ29731.1 hypothetical protein MARPO_0135s0016 [Marchantia polymorpha]BBN14493.1 hypothetical protein Mp_6g12200 [Marchantia polymorpha subsp. ruderalis]|eukprot:PTQ29731.1 hypothetical protein MARPO_0135s0016 [Marchantia polymorpha]